MLISYNDIILASIKNCQLFTVAFWRVTVKNQAEF